MQGQRIHAILLRLSSSEAAEAWADFLQEYSGIIVQVARSFEGEPDRIADAYVFVCQQLSRDRFRRLRTFRLDGPAQFSTWLRAVVRNLCLDWHRREFGRIRSFRSISRLSALEQATFQCIVERGMPLEDAYMALRPDFPDLTGPKLVELAEAIESSLTPRQRWILSVRRGRRSPAEEIDAPDGPGEALADWTTNPELRSTELELHRRLHSVVAALPEGDRLLLRLRYEQELTLEQTARLLGLDNAQQADRRIRELLEKLRKEIG